MEVGYMKFTVNENGEGKFETNISQTHLISIASSFIEGYGFDKYIKELQESIEFETVEIEFKIWVENGKIDVLYINEVSSKDMFLFSTAVLQEAGLI